MRIATRAGLCALLALLATPPQAVAQPLPFRLCADPNNPPLSSRSDSAPGIYIELGQRIAAAMGRPFQAVWTPRLFAKLSQKLRSGQCDGVIGLPEGVDLKGVADSDVILSKPFLAIGYAVVAQPSAGLRTLADLKGKRVAVQFGSPPQEVLAQDPTVDLLTVMTPHDALDALGSHKVDAAVIWGPSAGWINHGDLHDAYNVQPLTGEHLNWKVAIGLSSTRPDLRDAVDRALSGLSDSAQQLEVKYGLATPTPAAQPPAQTETPHAAKVQQTAASASTAQQAAAGHQLFNDNCSHCHGHDAVQGLEERNLMHLGKRYGDRMDQVFLFTVTHGRPAKGMPNWSGILTDQQFHDILAYLHTIQHP